MQITNIIVIIILNLAKSFLIFGLAYYIFWILKPQWILKYKIQIQEKAKPIPLFEFKYFLITIFIQALVIYSIIYYDLNSFSLLNVHFLFSFIGYFLIYDLYFYWLHRFLHQSWMYKNIHIIHHRSRNPTPWASYSFHPVEAVLNLLYLYVFVLIFKVDLKYLIFLLILTDFGNLAGHVGFDFLPKGVLKNKIAKWITTPTHHNLHHQIPNSNFGLYFRGWDIWYRTFNKKTDEYFLEEKH